MLKSHAHWKANKLSKGNNKNDQMHSITLKGRISPCSEKFSPYSDALARYRKFLTNVSLLFLDNGFSQFQDKALLTGMPREQWVVGLKLIDVTLESVLWNTYKYLFYAWAGEINRIPRCDWLLERAVENTRRPV